jgi:hypothetical protein
MQDFFKAIVELFEIVCRYTGFRYAELNILIYCLLVPGFWCSIVWYRNRQLAWLLILFVAGTVFYVFEKQNYLPFSLHFYHQNISALENLGATTGLGSVGISLLIGVLVPLFFSLALLFIRKQILSSIYLCYLAINLGYFCWVFSAVPAAHH